MKPKVIVTREIFDDVLEYLRQHFDVTDNQSDTPMDAETLAKNLAGKTGAMTTLVDRVDAQLLARCSAAGFTSHQHGSACRAQSLLYPGHETGLASAVDAFERNEPWLHRELAGRR